MLLTLALAPTAALLLARCFLVREDPFWILAPPVPCIRERFASALFKGALPLRARALLTLRNCAYALTLPLWTALWTFDDLFLSVYRAASLRKPTFVVGGFRTGTTSLHRSLALDEERFASPRFMELALPFLSLQLLLDALEACDRRWGTDIIAGIERSLQAAMGPEVMKRHPMKWYAAEEDDVLLAAWNWSGYYATLHCPTREWKLTAGQFSRMPPEAVARVLCCYERTMQKVLWRRGRGRALLSKSHLIELMPFLHRRFPDARFVGIQRHPRDAIPSWYSLARNATAVLACAEVPKEAYVAMHLAFWDEYYAAEAAFFADAAHSLPKRPAPAQADQRKFRLRFDDFVANRRDALADICTAFGDSFAGSRLEAELDSAAAEAAHKGYKQEHAYANPSLADLGLDLATVEERYGEYMLAASIPGEASRSSWEMVGAE